MNEIVKGMARNVQTDYPLLIILSLIGNDVCNGKEDTIASMTTSEEFYANTMETLQYLDQSVPTGSNVVLTGLADGRVLWDLMYDRYHPLGELNEDVKYR